MHADAYRHYRAADRKPQTQVEKHRLERDDVSLSAFFGLRSQTLWTRQALLCEAREFGAVLLEEAWQTSTKSLYAKTSVLFLSLRLHVYTERRWLGRHKSDDMSLYQRLLWRFERRI